MPTALRSVIRCDDAYLACAATTRRMCKSQHAYPEPRDALLYVCGARRARGRFRRAMLEPGKARSAARPRPRQDAERAAPSPRADSLGLLTQTVYVPSSPGRAGSLPAPPPEAPALRARRLEPSRLLPQPQAWIPRPFCCPPGVDCLCRSPSVRSARGPGGEFEARRVWRRRAFPQLRRHPELVDGEGGRGVTGSGSTRRV